MSTKIILLFTLLTNLAGLAADANFLGFKKGFLNQQSKSAPATAAKAKEQPEIKNPESALTIFESTFDHEPAANLWDDPAYHSKKMRHEIYEVVVSGVMNVEFTRNWLAGMEENFMLLDQGAYKTPCESLDFFMSVLRLWAYLNNCYTHRRTLPENRNRLKPEFHTFVMQNMVNWAIKAKFAYMKTLPSHKKDQYRSDFITTDSDDTHGEFVLRATGYGTGWGVPGTMLPACIRYVREALKNGDYIYRLVDQSLTSNEWVPIKGDDSLSYVSKGEIQYYQKSQTADSMRDSSFIASGMILDKDLRLVEQEGFVLVKGWLFPADTQIFYYAKHPWLDEMFFFEQELFLPTSMSPMAEALLQSVGGMEKLQEKEFIFIPNNNVGVSATQARWLLPILQGLQQTIDREKIDVQTRAISWIDEGINTLKNIIVDDVVAQQSDADKQVIIEEIVEVEIQQQLADKNSPIATEIEHKREEIKKTENTNAKQREKTFKREKKKIVKKSKNTKAQALDPALVQARQREKALAHVEGKYLKHAALKRSYSASDVHELLGEMVDELAPLGIERTGQAHARGSHAAVEVKDIQSGHQTHLSVAARPQKAGYQAGTLKTIIKDMIGKVKALHQ